MKAVIQRTLEASVTIDGNPIFRIGPGLLLLLGVEKIDDASDVDWHAGKIVKMRIFGDAEGKMNHSVMEIGGEIMVVSQFTLHASTQCGFDCGLGTTDSGSEKASMDHRHRALASSKTAA